MTFRDYINEKITETSIKKLNTFSITGKLDGVEYSYKKVTRIVIADVQKDSFSFFRVFVDDGKEFYSGDKQGKPFIILNKDFLAFNNIEGPGNDMGYSYNDKMKKSNLDKKYTA